MRLVEAYAQRAGLTVAASDVARAQQRFEAALAVARSASIPATPNALSALYEFRVPKLSPDGTCSLVEQLAEAPYDLGVTLGGRTLERTLSLMTLRALVDAAVDALKVDWLGVYQVRGPVLVKLAYAGAPSRAEFPLSSAFAVKSNNVAVALSGHARVISDVHAHVQAGGAYYECDPKVRAEACVPMFDTRGTVVGIIDAEHSTVGRFDGEALALLVALAMECPQHLPA